MTLAVGSCRTCGRDVGEVPVNPDMTLYGHLEPPHPSHRVRLTLAKSTDERNSTARAGHVGRGDIRRSTSVREDAPHLIATGTRAARKGLPRTATPSEAPSSSPRRRRVAAGSTPGSGSTSAPRSAGALR